MQDIKKLTGIVLTELELLKTVGPTPREVPHSYLTECVIQWF
jgi:hypothetical protein